MSKGYYLNKKGYYVIDKRYQGERIFTTTRYRQGEQSEVEAVIREEVDKIYQAKRRGQRPTVVFRDCAVEYCLRNEHQKQIKDFAGLLGRLDKHVGDVVASDLYQEHPAIVRLVFDLKSKGRKNSTINAYLEAITRVLNAATQWRYEWCDLTWLETAPRFTMLQNDYRPPHPISWDDQERLLSKLPEHLKGEVVVYVHAGLRESELNTMQWRNELVLPGGIMGFIVTAKGSARNKHRQRLVLMNDRAKEVIEARRGENPEYVFVYKGEPKLKSNTNAFRLARKAAGVNVRVQDLRHTFGHRLRETGYDEETRAELLGHKGKSITTHYSAASIQRLHEAVQQIMVKTTHQVVVNLEDYRRTA